MNNNFDLSLDKEVTGTIENIMKAERPSKESQITDDYWDALLLIDMCQSAGEVIFDDFSPDSLNYRKYIAVFDDYNVPGDTFCRLKTACLEDYQTTYDIFRTHKNISRKLFDDFSKDLHETEVDIMKKLTDAKSVDDKDEIEFVLSNCKEARELVTSVYINTLNIEIIKQKILIAKLQGEEFCPVRSKDIVCRERKKKWVKRYESHVKALDQNYVFMQVIQLLSEKELSTCEISDKVGISTELVEEFKKKAISNGYLSCELFLAEEGKNYIQDWEEIKMGYEPTIQF